MSGVDIAFLSIAVMLMLIYSGIHVAIALILLSFGGVWLLRGNFDIASNMLVLAFKDSISDYLFGVVPLFVLMGLLVAVAGIGRDTFEVAAQLFRRVAGGLGIATVAANAVFAAITGISIASAAVFTKVAVPEMIRHGYTPRFAVGVVAGSSVLGMLIPPSILLIIYAILTEQSIGMMFYAGIGPGILLSGVYCAGIIGMAYLVPRFVYDLDGRFSDPHSAEPGPRLTPGELVRKAGPLLLLITIVLGGIYGGVFTPTEAGAVGSLAALVIAVARRSLTLRGFWNVLLETGHITASVCFLIIAATMYSRALTVAGVPFWLSGLVSGGDDSFLMVMLIYIAVILLLGTIIDSVSIILIMVPLFLPILHGMGADIVWFGIITIISVEIGLLTPPLGMACFVIKGSLPDERIKLGDIFAGAAPFAAMMLFVVALLVSFPDLVYIGRWFGM